jgi:predicted nucleic acid-binding protein
MKLVKIRRVGNSNVVSIPREFEDRGFSAGASVLVEELPGGELRILPTEKVQERIRETGRRVVAEHEEALQLDPGRARPGRAESAGVAGDAFARPSLLKGCSTGEGPWVRGRFAPLDHEARVGAASRRAHSQSARALLARCENHRVRFVIERAEVEEVVGRLTRRDSETAEDARAAIEWLTADREEDAPVVFTRYRLQLFLWYELPRNWLVEPDEHLAVAEALGLFFDEFGQPAAPLVVLCRSPETTRLLRDEGEGFVEAIEASGLEPPDSPLLEWSDLMTIEESLEREAVAEMLEQAVDEGRLVPGAPGWRERQVELVERHLIRTDEGNATPLSRIHAARREAWLERAADDERALLETATSTADGLPTRPEAEAAIEPLLWLLGLLADGVKLTQTGALPRSLVRAAVGRYPDWWDTDLFGLPHREAEVYPLEVLHIVVDDLKLARPRRGILKLGPRGRSLRADPAALLSTIAATIATTGGSVQLDLALADLLAGDPHDLDFRLLHLLGPFYGIIGGRFRREAQITPGGHTLAAAILRARAYGPRHSFI